MKKLVLHKITLLTVCCLLLSLFEMRGQVNLVLNPSFENYTTCPVSLDQMQRCLFWASTRESADYFNACSGTPGLSPPNSAFGYRTPHLGNAYAGICSFDNTGINPDYREHIGGVLSSSLIVGQKYFISFFISRGGHSSYSLASSHIGVKFSKTFFSNSNPSLVNNSAHFYSNSIISDTINWTKISGSFLADSAYKYIMVGNFFDDNSTDTLSTGNFNQASYYYLDDICVSTDSLFANDWTGIKKTDYNSEFNLFPNPSNGLIYYSGVRSPLEICLKNSLGQTVYQFSVSQDEHRNPIDLKFLPSGIYYPLLPFSNYTKVYQPLIIINQ